MLDRHPIIHTAASGAPVVQPLVEAVVAGEPTLLVVDTGASAHVITDQLAATLGLTLREGDPGTDATGASVPSWATGPVSLRFGPCEVVIEHVVVIAAPGAFRESGIGGVFSPQWLAEGENIVDLAGHELLVGKGPASDELTEAIRSRTDGLRRVQVTSRAGGLLTVDVGAVTAAGRVRGLGLLDTGSARTEFDARSLGVAPGPAGERQGARGIGGTVTQSRPVAIEGLTVGGLQVALREVWAGAPIPQPEGFRSADAPVVLVGMDVLASAVLRVGASPSLFVRADVDP